MRAHPGFVTSRLVDFFIEFPPDPLDRGDPKSITGFYCQGCPDFGTESAGWIPERTVDVVRGKIIQCLMETFEAGIHLLLPDYGFWLPSWAFLLSLAFVEASSRLTAKDAAHRVLVMELSTGYP